MCGGRSHLPSPRVREVSRLPCMAKLGSTPVSADAPPLDSGAVEQAYRLHRARRAAREARAREVRHASFRFWLVLAVALLAAALLAERTMGEIERVFGL